MGGTKLKKIYLVDRNCNLKSDLQVVMKSKAKIIKCEPDDIEKMLKNIPDMFIINEDGLDEKDDVLSICETIRDDEDNAITPIIVLSSNTEKEHIKNVLKKKVELYLDTKTDCEILDYYIQNLMRLLNSNRMVSPLTGLPGNVQIKAEMKKRLMNKEYFAMLYIDLDNFKAYNDTYGFSNGDEIIKFTANIISKYVLQGENEENNFVGHIGGDDFIAIVSDENFEEICQNIVAEFDNQVGKFFNKTDVERGYIEVENRKGLMEQFPLTSVSIGVVEVTADRFKNTLEIGEAGAAVKHLAKTIYGSTYVIDRRKNRDERKKTDLK